MIGDQIPRKHFPATSPQGDTYVVMNVCVYWEGVTFAKDQYCPQLHGCVGLVLHLKACNWCWERGPLENAGSVKPVWEAVLCSRKSIGFEVTQSWVQIPAFYCIHQNSASKGFISSYNWKIQWAALLLGTATSRHSKDVIGNLCALSLHFGYFSVGLTWRSLPQQLWAHVTLSTEGWRKERASLLRGTTKMLVRLLMGLFWVTCTPLGGRIVGSVPCEPGKDSAMT